MAKLNLEKLRKHIQAFEFQTLFNSLGWSNPSTTRATQLVINDAELSYSQIAQLSGVVILEIIAENNTMPEAKTRLAVHEKIATLHHEHVLIFVDKQRTQSCWFWMKREGVKHYPRTHFYFKGQSGELLLSKLSAMNVDFSELDDEGNIAIIDVAKRLKTSLDIEPITKKFFKEFEQKHSDFVEHILGISNEKNRAWYASVLLHRLMFIWFLQKKGFVNNGELNYLSDKLTVIQTTLGENRYYRDFLKPLFFQGFAKPENERGDDINKLLGKIRYLNGGLFLPHSIEERYDDIQVNDKAFSDLFALFNQYSWNLNDTIGGADNEINPDVLGYIFEKYINQKAFGAYYTRPEITDYLCERTISKLILDRVNSLYAPLEFDFNPVHGDINSVHGDINSVRGELVAVRGELVEPRPSTSSGRTESVTKSENIKQFKDLPDLLFKLDAPLCRELLLTILPSLSLLDPACGSGAFLVAAMKTLINIYSAIIGRIKFIHDDGLTQWLKETETAHKNIDYFIKKEIIKNNLYGVDIMPEATEIAKLRLFLALVSSARTVEELEPLPNIDFNIMAGNSLIGLLAVEGEKFNSLGQTGDIFRDNEAQSYTQILNEKNRLISNYKDSSSYSESLTSLRDLISENRTKNYKKLNRLLLTEFERLQIKYEQATWDEAKNKLGKPIKRALTMADINSLQPFHWGYEFDAIFARGGFDAIITNPPWEVLQADEKEFFQQYTPEIKKNKLRIEDWKNQLDNFMGNIEIRETWLNYVSDFSYTAKYFKNSQQYKHNVSIVNGKNVGSKINLYTYFTEQCFNLLKDNGECGIIIPSGIYSDLGATGLRKLLFNEIKLGTLFGLSNEKFIFSEVHHGFRFCLLTFEKGGATDKFNSVFRINPREAIAADKLSSFLNNEEILLKISTDLVKKLSPDSLSIMEFKNDMDITIAKKMLIFPLLGEKLKDTWNLKLTSEFNMTTASYLFKTEYAEGRLPLYEGKMIHQFTHTWGESKYWIDEAEGRVADLGKNEDIGQVLDYQGYRLGFRDVAASTNERTMIATILPPNVFTGNTLVISMSPKNNSELLFIVALLNSFVVDALIRQKVTAHCNMFYVYQLPIPRLSEKDPQFKAIVERAAALICTTPEFDDLKQALKNSGYDIPPVETRFIASLVSLDLETRLIASLPLQIRAELDAMIAHLYGLTEDEFAHILATFPIVKEDVKAAALAAFKYS